MKRILLLSLLSALIFSGAASAATIQDLQALGYTVNVANPGPSGQNCPIYVLSGWGITNLYFTCHDQDVIDQLANPTAHCDRVWQFSHPDQLAAYNNLTRKGWAISGDQCADSYQVTNPNTGVTAYSGPGAGLISFDGANDAPPAAVGNQPVSPVTPSNCLPLCPNPGDSRGGPNGQTITPASPSDPQTTPAAPPYESPVRIGALLYV